MESLGNIGSRKRITGNHYSAEEQALDQIAKEVHYSPTDFSSADVIYVKSV